jgi:hypothetical protein
VKEHVLVGVERARRVTVLPRRRSRENHSVELLVAQDVIEMSRHASAGVRRGDDTGSLAPVAKPAQVDLR